MSNISPTASWTNLDFGTYYVVESFAGITNTKTYEVKDPLTIEVNGEETDTFVNEVRKRLHTYYKDRP